MKFALRAHGPRRTSGGNDSGSDRGSVLPMVLVFTVVISMVVVAVADYTTTGLRYGRVVEARADRLSAADGGLRYAIQKLERVGHHECPRIDPPDINGAVVTLTCEPVGSSFGDTEGYALVLTGETVPAGQPLVDAQGGASESKRISGLVYMNRLDFSLNAPMQFENGQLQYTVTPSDPSVDPCPTTHVLRNDGSPIDTSLPLADVRFTADHYGVVCTTQPWLRAGSNLTDDPATLVNEQGKFTEPDRPDLATLPVNPGSTINGTCTVFEPGHYTVAPVLGNYNYFLSGNYLFDGITMSVGNSKVTAGRAVAESNQAIPNTACINAINGDTVTNVTEAGATFYLQNGAHFEVEQNGTLEIMRRKQGRRFVSIHLLDNSLAWNQDVILQGPGSNKDMAMHGMVWAPTARITFSNVANIAKAQLLGGAVVSNIKVDSAAGTAGLVISVEPGDITGLLQLDSTATSSDGGTTTIRSIVDYRPSTKYAAATSWRVLD
jgi:hypothetical protein